jgi:hypothetical protein
LDRSRRPHHRVKKALRGRLLARRQRTHIGPARLRTLLLTRGTKHVPSAMTIPRLLKRAGRIRRRRAKPKRYRRVFVVPRPGDFIQLDV